MTSKTRKMTEDKKAKKILFSYYWKNGWNDKKDRTISAQDFAYAKDKGIMYDPLSSDHDKLVKGISALSKKIDESDVIKAFISSLSSQRLDWRSGIVSYYLSQKIREHVYTPIKSGESYDSAGNVTQISYTCKVCRDARHGIIGSDQYIDIDLNV